VGRSTKKGRGQFHKKVVLGKVFDMSDMDCAKIFVWCFELLCQETPRKTQEKASRMVGGWVWDLANARGVLGFF
jgi:hypothetical protein